MLAEAMARDQRGFVLPAFLSGIWAKLGLVLAILAAAGALVYAVTSYLDGIDARGYERGKKEVHAQYAQRDNQALREVIEERDRLAAEVRRIEDDRSRAVSAAAENYEKGKADGKQELDTAIARVHAGYRLRDPGRRTAGAAGQSAGAVSAPVASTSCGDGAAGAELSEQSSRFLLELAAEADERVRQLTACQAVVAADRSQ